MENIFIDTSIFIKENFLDGKRLQQLLKLGEENQIQLVLTRVTVDEIKSRFNNTVNSFKEQTTKFYALKNLESGKALLNAANALNGEFEFNIILDERLAKSNAIIIEYKKIEINKLMANYFEGKPPFNSKSKKNEFPDAIAIQLIEEWCIANNQVIKTISTDKDFEGYDSRFVSHEKSYEDYINDKIKSYELYQKRIEILNNLVKKNGEQLNNYIKHWYKTTLDDSSLYYSFIHHEIHDVEVADVEITDKEYKIIYIDDESIQIEITADVYFTVELTIDDEEYSVYDEDIRDFIYLETTTEAVERQVKAKVIAIAFIEDEKQFEDDLEIIDINKGIKFKVDPESSYR